MSTTLTLVVDGYQFFLSRECAIRTKSGPLVNENLKFSNQTTVKKVNQLFLLSAILQENF